MKLKIADIINYNKSFVFLCGSFYKEDSSDKRFIIKKYIEHYSTLFPVIIDNAFDPDGFVDRSLSVALMEEIIAKIAKSTIVLVESYSSSAELGLFGATGKNNQIIVIVPMAKDVENYKIGVFIDSAFSSSASNIITKVPYRPAIKKVAINHNWIDEHYYFKNNKLPNAIGSEIDKIASNNNPSITIEIVNSFDKNNLPLEFNQIRFFSIGNIVSCEISTFLLFYVVLGLIYKLKIKKDDYDKNKLIEMNATDVLINTIILNSNELRAKNYNEFQFMFKTDINEDFSLVINHIFHIILLFFNDENLDDFKNSFSRISIFDSIDKQSLYYSIYEKLSISKLVIRPNRRNYQKARIKSKGKIREIIMYAENDEGTKLRNLHDNIKNMIMKNYSIHESSYAYKVNMGIKDYVLVHRYSKYFLQMDISKFFNSILQYKLAMKMEEIFGTNHIESTINLLDSAFVKMGEELILPLGFSISPILSDIYMNDFDREFSKYALENSLKYTRYADDITFSSYKEFDFEKVSVLVQQHLNQIGLEVNVSKTKKVIIKNVGDHIRLLGVNLVKKQNSNGLELTVGNKYINILANEIVGKSNLNYEKESFIRERLIGKIAFIQLINAKDISKLIKKIRLYTSETNYKEIIEKYPILEI